jgi:hypothetical protein
MMIAMRCLLLTVSQVLQLGAHAAPMRVSNNTIISRCSIYSFPLSGLATLVMNFSTITVAFFDMERTLI